MKRKPLDNIKVLGGQVNLIVGDIKGNARKILDTYQKGVDDGVDLVVMPELSLTSYPLEDALLQHFKIQHAMEVAKLVAQRTNSTTGLLFGLPRVDRDGNTYNSVCFAHSGRIIQWIDKQELPNSEVFDEVRYFKPGQGSGLVHFKGFSLGVAVCEDIWHPNVALNLARQGAEAIISLNASPYYDGKDVLRNSVAKQRVTDTNIPILYLNLVGGQDELVFDGASFTWNPQDKIPTNVQPACEESIFTVELLRDNSGCFFHRGSSVSELSGKDLMYKALVMATRDYVHKNGFSKIVLGLSGGVDSALVLAIAVEAFGADNVTAIMMPYDYTSDMSKSDAKLIAENFGVDYRIVPIVNDVKASIQALQNVGYSVQGLAEENQQARARGKQLMSISNETGALLLSTGNKSEVAMGFCTLYGDMNGGFNPLKDMYKTDVFNMCFHINEMYGSEMIPERIITRPPTAELSADKVDADTLPDYVTVLDPILKLFMEKRLSPEDIIQQGFKQTDVLLVLKGLSIAEHKRRQSCPGPKVNQVSFTRPEWRMSLTNGFNYKAYFDFVNVDNENFLTWLAS